MCQENDQITFYEMSDFSEPQSNQISFVAGGSALLTVNLTINGAKADKNGHYLMFGTEEGYLIEADIHPDSKTI